VDRRCQIDVAPASFRRWRRRVDRLAAAADALYEEVVVPGGQSKLPLGLAVTCGSARRVLPVSGSCVNVVPIGGFYRGAGHPRAPLKGNRAGTGTRLPKPFKESALHPKSGSPGNAGAMGAAREGRPRQSRISIASGGWNVRHSPKAIGAVRRINQSVETRGAKRPCGTASSC
jgi:hypothetical protein